MSVTTSASLLVWRSGSCHRSVPLRRTGMYRGRCPVLSSGRLALRVSSPATAARRWCQCSVASIDPSPSSCHPTHQPRAHYLVQVELNIGLPVCSAGRLTSTGTGALFSIGSACALPCLSSFAASRVSDSTSPGASCSCSCSCASGLGLGGLRDKERTVPLEKRRKIFKIHYACTCAQSRVSDGGQ